MSLTRLSDFPEGTRVRHEAYVVKKYINTLYGIIRNNSIETDGLDAHGKIQVFHTPMDFIRAHKSAKIRSSKRQTIYGNPWKIVEYYDEDRGEWRGLREYTPPIKYHEDTQHDELDDDTLSFVTCLSTEEMSDTSFVSTEETIDAHLKIKWERVDTIEIWKWSLWGTPEFAEEFTTNQNEYYQDEQNLDEIQDELDYELLDREYPWITRFNLPHEEELWIALRTILPVFGQVWMDAAGNCWEDTDPSSILRSSGKWIGKWSWDRQMMDLGAKCPDQLVDDEEFWDILQEFENFD
jgi:hypothetical protein